MTYGYLLAGVIVLLGLTTATMTWGGVDARFMPWWAIVRAAGQLTLISLALRGVLVHPALVAVALSVMFAAAVWTAGRRLHDLPGAATGVVVACGLGAGITLTIAFLLSMLQFDSRYVVALGGIVIGSTMTAGTLAGRNFRRAAIAQRPEIEGWLAIGASPSQSVADVGREAAHDALVPVIDQTRTTGLVTLPGAFVGALMGGASPVDAGRFQLVVLVTLITAQTITSVVLVRILGRSPVLPVSVARGSMNG
ncbi:ABC transporter permease [Antrihabitans cavernicola]|uniref:ABC transporter permease n=1 Tax=Antrihabitans cavernicola TaxID=2495913 RepID=A0A5A7SD51_9NOCA|nr:ABC transporter permease [Spelaeibacter cavernicola]KAA0022657.1 ABC transporter permease [Spelaeibacter cavernicola]